MQRKVLLYAAFGILFFALFLQWVRLPVSQGDMWMSPDETAVATSAATFVANRSFLFPVILSDRFAWVHPRSFVYLPANKMLAPVGFLGLPALLSLPYKAFGVLGMNLFTPVLVLLTLFAIWRILPQRWSKAAKVLTLVMWATFPTVVLYANRGLFAQLPVACLAIWGWWGMATSVGGRRSEVGRQRTINALKVFLAGLAFGLAAVIRPTELPWLLPVLAFALLWRNSKLNPDANNLERAKLAWWQWSAFVMPCFVILALGAWFGYDTYGKWWVSGYQIRPQAVAVAGDATTTIMNTDIVSVFQTLPFAFHPRIIWWNLSHYHGTIMWPWLLATAGTLVLLGYGFFLKSKTWDRATRWRGLLRWDIFALIWPAFWTVAFYGNGLYQDNIRLGEVTLGNSFLRYTLPATLALVVASGYVIQRMWAHWSLKILAVCLAMALASVGLWTALSRDAEGVLANVEEIARYHGLRELAKDDFDENGVIVSERSDKVFFPSRLSVSPMPTDDQIHDLLVNGHPVGALMTTQDQDGQFNWLLRGFVITPMHQVGNQTLYDVKAY